MNKIFLIVKREYNRRIHEKSFILLTVLMPFLLSALVIIPLWLSSFETNDSRSIAIIDTTGKYAPLFKDTENYHFIHSELSLETYRNKSSKEIFAFLSITDNLLNNPHAATIYSEKQVPDELIQMINLTLKRQIENDKLASFNIPNLKQIIQSCDIEFNIQSIKWNDDGSEQQSSTEIASIIGMAFTLLIYTFILAYGAMVMQGVMEEKNNRIVEIMISSVRPFELMLGKIIGIGFVGLFQMFIWSVMTCILLFAGSLWFNGGSDIASANGEIIGSISNLSIPLSSGDQGLIHSLLTMDFMRIGTLFIIYFIGGYLMYAAVFAAIGSSVNSQEDSQQFMLPITLFLAFTLYAGLYSAENPDRPLAFWCSMIPFTSPIVMMIRAPFDVPTGELILSIVFLYCGAFGSIWFSAKIYRVGILMYGKKPNIKELIKWTRYK